jgi:threonine/homoserine/homoserine lactone efflux protein
MDLTWFLPLLGFALITCGTPGPNNMLLTAAGANLGFRASVPMLFSVVTGLNLIMLATALGLGVVFASLPVLHQGLRIIGSVYLLWLAWKLTNAGEPGDRNVAEMPGWCQAAFLQLLNPKGWFMALSAVGSFTLNDTTKASDSWLSAYWASAIAILATFFLMGILTGSFWVLFGAQVRRLIRTAKGWQRFNLTMGFLTAGCVLMVWM